MKHVYKKMKKNLKVILGVVVAVNAGVQAADPVQKPAVLMATQVMKPEVQMMTLPAASPQNTQGDLYASMIAMAVAKPTVADRVEALNGFMAVAGTVDAATVTSINQKFADAVTAVFNAARNDAVVSSSMALRKMLTSASTSNILNDAQRASVTQWVAGLPQQAAPAMAAPAAVATVETPDSSVMKSIAALDKEEDDSKRLEGVYHLLQQAAGHSFAPATQEEFGKLLVKAFNSTVEAHSYLKQILHEVADHKTPLLADSHIDYVKKQMLPRLNGDSKHHDEDKEHHDANATPAKGAKKGAKGKHGKGGKKHTAVAGATPEHAADVHADATAAGHAAHAAGHAKKGKGKKKGHGKVAHHAKATKAKAAGHAEVHDEHAAEHHEAAH